MLRNLTVSGAATVGVTVDASYVELVDVAADGNGAGFDLFTGSIVIAKGTIQARDNAGSGVAVNLQSTLELRGARLDTVDNGGDGVTVVNNANLVILSFPGSAGQRREGAGESRRSRSLFRELESERGRFQFRRQRRQWV